MVSAAFVSGCDSLGVDEVADSKYTSRPLIDVAGSVEMFIEYAVANPDLEFQVTRIGCGLAGFLDEDMSPMFKHAPSNCLFDSAWKPWLSNVKFWGTF